VKRVLIAIGCNNYDRDGLDDLAGAEFDAKRVYDQLIQLNVGNYDPIGSRLFLSPTLDELRGALNGVLFEQGKLDTLTVYFAGHGLVNSVGFYMCLRDTRLGQFSTSAFGLGVLLSQIAEAQPAQTNIIIDACCSGGLTADLGIVPKSVSSGDAGSPAVTLLAMAARDQSAIEEDAGGVGTNALLDCITGRAFVQEATSALNLTEIGHVVADRLPKHGGQSPTVTSLNVHQRSIFCRNPHYQASGSNAFSKWDPRTFLDVIDPILVSHADSPADLIANVERLTDGLLTRAKGLLDRFREPEVLAVCIGALLPFCGAYPLVQKHVMHLLQKISDIVRNRLDELTEDTKANKYVLLCRFGGMGDLYAIPLRITKIIGWIGACYHIDKVLGREDSFPIKQYTELMDHLIADYPLSISIMSDTQGPYIALALSAAHELGLQSQAEDILSLLFRSVLRTKGVIADSHIEPKLLLNYLICRSLEDFSNDLSLVARPSETITVLLRCASVLGMNDVFDDALQDLDHIALNAYITDDYGGYSKRYVEGGENASFVIGHGIWRVSDLDAAWPEEAAQRPANLSIQGGAIISSLIFPDRVPWFVLAPSVRKSEA
jgi:hypothetical protein